MPITPAIKVPKPTNHTKKEMPVNSPSNFKYSTSIFQCPMAFKSSGAILWCSFKISNTFVSETSAGIPLRDLIANQPITSPKLNAFWNVVNGMLIRWACCLPSSPLAFGLVNPIILKYTPLIRMYCPIGFSVALNNNSFTRGPMTHIFRFSKISNSLTNLPCWILTCDISVTFG